MQEPNPIHPTPSQERAAFKEKLRSLQFPRRPFVDQRDAAGSTQVYHTTGRVDADVHVAAPLRGLGETNQLKGVE